MNFYNILNSNINDSQKDIKKNYYKLCKKYHPDKNYNNQSDHIKKINLAYEVLGDPQKRNKYLILITLICYTCFIKLYPIIYYKFY